MSAVLLGREEQSSPEWHALRSKGLGGSEIAAVVGLSPWTSRFALYHRKRGNIGEQFENAGMSWGKRLEPVVAQAFCEAHPEVAARIGGTYRHEERTWQLANPDLLLAAACDCDGLIHQCPSPEPTSLLEVKTAHQYDAWEWGYGDEDVPPYYRCQAVWYADVFELPKVNMAVLIGGSDYREYVIPWVADEAEWLRNEGEKFWHEVTAGVDPPIDGHDATYRAIREMHPGIERSVEAEIDADLWAHYQSSKSKAADWAAIHQGFKSEVLALMGDAQFATVDGTSVLRRQPGRGGSVSLYEIKQPAHESTGDAA